MSSISLFVQVERDGEVRAVAIRCPLDAVGDAHVYWWRMRAALPDGRRFFSGSSSDESHESLDDNDPQLALPLLAGSGPMELVVELALRKGTRRVQHYRGATVLAGEDGTLELAPCEALVGVPFELDGKRVRPRDQAPELDPTVIVPGFGRLSLADCPFEARDWLRASATGWVAARRGDGLAIFRPAQPGRVFHVDEPAVHAGFDTGGEVLWFCDIPHQFVAGHFGFVDLSDGAVRHVTLPKLVDEWVASSRGNVIVSGSLICGFVDEELEIHDWRLDRPVERRRVASFPARPLFHPAARRVGWLLPLGTDLASVLRWQDLDGLAAADIVVPDALGDGVMLADGRVVAAGARSTWLVNPAEGSARALGIADATALLMVQAHATGGGRWFTQPPGKAMATVDF